MSVIVIVMSSTIEYREQMEKAGFIFSGTSPDGRLVEIIELKITHGSWHHSSTQNSFQDQLVHNHCSENLLEHL